MPKDKKRLSLVALDHGGDVTCVDCKHIRRALFYGAHKDAQSLIALWCNELKVVVPSRFGCLSFASAEQPTADPVTTTNDSHVFDAPTPPSITLDPELTAISLSYTDAIDDWKAENCRLVRP